VNENEKVLVAHKLRDPNAKTKLTTYDMTSGSRAPKDEWEWQLVNGRLGKWLGGEVGGWESYTFIVCPTTTVTSGQRLEPCSAHYEQQQQIAEQIK